MDKTIPFSLYSLRLLRVQVCNLNPTFYIFDLVIDCIQRYYPNKPIGSGCKPEPAKERHFQLLMFSKN